MKTKNELSAMAAGCEAVIIVVILLMGFLCGVFVKLIQLFFS